MVARLGSIAKAVVAPGNHRHVVLNGCRRIVIGSDPPQPALGEIAFAHDGRSLGIAGVVLACQGGSAINALMVQTELMTGFVAMASAVSMTLFPNAEGKTKEMFGKKPTKNPPV